MPGNPGRTHGLHNVASHRRRKEIIEKTAYERQVDGLHKAHRNVIRDKNKLKAPGNDQDRGQRNKYGQEQPCLINALQRSENIWNIAAHQVKQQAKKPDTDDGSYHETFHKPGIVTHLKASAAI